MENFKLQVTRSLIGKFDYRFYTQEGTLLYIGSLDPLITEIDSITKDVSLLPFTIYFESPCGEEFFSVHKKRGTLLKPVSFSIVHPGGRAVVTEGRRFEIPNLIIKSPAGDIFIVGQVRDLSFSLKLEDRTLADIQATREDGGKSYSISVYDTSLPKQIYLGACLILDNLYQDY